MRGIFTILIFGLVAQLTKAQTTSLSGSGTNVDPFLIQSVNDLKFFRDKINETSGSPDTNTANVYDAVGAYFKLTADLDMSAEATAWVSIGSNPNVQNNFKGHFDGNNKTISNLTIGTSGTPVYQNPNSGLFGTASNSATIKNLTLSNISFYLNRTSAGSFMVGGLAGQITAGVKIENCHVSGVINSTNSDNTNGADMEIGGLVGKIQRGPAVTPDLVQIINSSTNVSIVAKSTSTFTTSDKKVYVAGIVGNYAAANFTNTPEVINCYSKGSVEGESTLNNAIATRQAVQVGGIWGNNCGKLYNCYASGNLKGKTVTANVNACGITGYINTGTITKCYGVMDAIDITTTSGTQVGRRIANGTGTNQIISAYSLANTKVNGSAETLYITETEPNGLNISSADFITGLNAYVSANPTNNGVNLKTWAAVSASSNDVAKGTVAGATTIPVFTGQSYSTTLTATPTTGNHFVNWTESGSEVSTNATYTFTASASRTLVANFEPNTVPVSSGTTNASTITCTTCDVTVAAGAELTVGATKTLKSVTVAAGGKLTISGGNLNVTNGITLESTADATATILDSYSTPTITATVKQQVSAGRNWYLSSPVSAADYSWLNRGTSVQGWNEATKAWVPVTNGTLVRGKGYVQVATSTPEVTGTTGTVNVTGTTNSGDVAITVSRTESGSSRGFNLVGNPYPSYLKWGTGENGFLADATNDSISTSFWYRTQNTDGAYVFTTYNGSSHLVVGGTNVNSALNEYIPPMQAFWIRVNANTAVTTHNVVLTFKNNMRFHGVGDNNKFKAPKNNDRQLIRLQLANGTQSDEALIYFDTAAANTFDNYDSPKMMNNSNTLPDLYTTVANERLAINGLNGLTDNMELPLGFTLKVAATGLKLKASELSNLTSGTKVYLLDKEQGSQTELLPSTEYTFNTTASTTNNESRFSLIFRTPSNTTGIETTEKTNAQVFVNAANQITIIAPEKSNYAIYNAVGQLIENGVLNTERETRNTKHLAAGLYVVKVNNVTERVIVK